ncbi:type II and III secretion system protein family protein [Rhizobacter sp. Root1221]|uniref:type II and III secretion system protein family protein n=1 Tax=Rhizobacter sp. Root1221 TaxID=1736433 RepID=UPI0009EAB515|nr:type II and III secretion system protein family protein [Rhizobacter sp. Root1221]
MSTPFHPSSTGSHHVLRRIVLALTASVSLAPATGWAQAGAIKLSAAAPTLARVAAPARDLAPGHATSPCARVEVGPVVQVGVGKSTVIRPASPITRILLGNPEGSRAARPTESKGQGKDDRDAGTGGMSEDKMRPGVAELDVLLLSPTEVYLLGKSIGSTNVVLLDKAGQCTAFDVVVNMDTGALQTVIGQLLPEEKNVRVASAFDSIVLTGSVTDAGAVIRLMDLANAYVRGSGGGTGASVAGANPRIVNMLSTGAPQQVMLEVKVAEVSKALIDKLGAQLSGSKTNGDWTYRLLADFLTGSNGVVQALKAGSGFSLALDGQKDDGMVKILAEPTVMAISGQKGSFLAGGKIFIPVSQENTGGGRTVTLEEKQFGVSVAFVPTVLDGGRINLEVATEVSELNRDGIGISAPGVGGRAVLPSFTSRSAKTTVQLMDGQSFAIGGLIKNNTTANIKAFPILGELPIVGALFRSTEFQSDKSELVFVITPRLAKPLPAAYALPTDNYTAPSRADVQVFGRLEGSRREAPATRSAAPAPAAAAEGVAATDGFQVK